MHVKDIKALHVSDFFNMRAPNNIKKRIVVDVSFSFITGMIPNNIQIPQKSQLKNIFIDGGNVWNIVAVFGCRRVRLKNRKSGLKNVRKNPTEIVIFHDTYHSQMNVFHDHCENSKPFH